MLKAGALYYAIFVAFIISLACIVMMMNAQLHQVVVIQYTQSAKLERNIQSAFVLNNEDPGLVKLNETKELPLYDNDEDMVTASKWRWGVFTVLKVSVLWKEKERAKIALTGNDLSSGGHVALYLADKERYLSVSGRSLLKGNCFLPSLGIRRAYIEGKSFLGQNLVEGKMGKSTKDLPEINLSGIEEEVMNISQNLNSTDSLVSAAALSATGGINHSFYNRTLSYFSPDWIYLNNQQVRGNIRIISAKGIIVNSSTILENVIITAPKVELKSGFTGSVQVFATDTLIIGEKCQLLSPSALVMLSAIEKPRVIVANDCRLKGDIVVSFKEGTQQIKPELKLARGARVEGQVYVNGMVEMEGAIAGSLYCNGFVLRTPNATYENHLLDVVIDYTALSSHYTGMAIFPSKLKNKTLKWLN
jgi:hypothetical protein